MKMQANFPSLVEDVENLIQLGKSFSIVSPVSQKRHARYFRSVSYAVDGKYCWNNRVSKVIDDWFSMNLLISIGRAWEAAYEVTSTLDSEELEVHFDPPVV